MVVKSCRQEAEGKGSGLSWRTRCALEDAHTDLLSCGMAVQADGNCQLLWLCQLTMFVTQHIHRMIRRPSPLSSAISHCLQHARLGCADNAFVCLPTRIRCYATTAGLC